MQPTLWTKVFGVVTLNPMINWAMWFLFKIMLEDLLKYVGMRCHMEGPPFVSIPAPDHLWHHPGMGIQIYHITGRNPNDWLIEFCTGFKSILSRDEIPMTGRFKDSNLSYHGMKSQWLIDWILYRIQIYPITGRNPNDRLIQRFKSIISVLSPCVLAHNRRWVDHSSVRTFMGINPCLLYTSPSPRD